MSYVKCKSYIVISSFIQWKKNGCSHSLDNWWQGFARRSYLFNCWRSIFFERIFFWQNNCNTYLVVLGTHLQSSSFRGIQWVFAQVLPCQTYSTDQLHMAMPSVNIFQLIATYLMYTYDASFKNISNRIRNPLLLISY